MTGTLFQRDIPGESSTLKSQEVRDNFNALDDRTGALEVRAVLDSSSNPTTKLNVTAGVVYNRSGIAVNLGLIDFKGGMIDLATALGFLNKKDDNGDPDINKDSEGNLVSDTTGVSPFPSARKRYFRELLIAIKPNGRLTFIEGFESADGRSASYNIYYPDSYIPLALVIVRNNGEIESAGQIEGISQAKIRDIRPFITTSFENGPQAETAASVESLNSRVSVLEESSEINSSTLAILPRVIPGETVSTYPIYVRSIEIVPGNIYVNGELVEFNGATITFCPDEDKGGASVPNGIFDCGPYNNVSTDEYTNITSLVAGEIGDEFNSVLVGLDTEGKIVCIHGEYKVVLPALVKPEIPINIYPIVYVIYQGNSSNNGIRPIVYFDGDGDRDVVSGQLTASGEKRVVTNGVIDGNDISGSSLLSNSVGSAGSLTIQVEDTTNFYTDGRIRILDNNTAPVDTIVTGTGAVALVPSSVGVILPGLVTIDFGYTITSIFGLIGSTPQIKIQDNTKEPVEISASVESATELKFNSPVLFDPTNDNANKVRIINLGAPIKTLTLAKYVKDLDITNEARAINPELGFEVREDIRPFLLQLDLGSTFRKLITDPIDMEDGDVWYNLIDQKWRGFRDGYGSYIEFDFTEIP